MNTSKTIKLFSHDPVYDFPENKESLLHTNLEEVRTVKEIIADPAVGFLKEAQAAMEARAALRDTPEGERTAGKIAKVFNSITGHDLTESDAWLFLLVLKIVRSRNGNYSRDDYVDMAAYSALWGEHESMKPK